MYRYLIAVIVDMAHYLHQLLDPHPNQDQAISAYQWLR